MPFRSLKKIVMRFCFTFGILQRMIPSQDVKCVPFASGFKCTCPLAGERRASEPVGGNWGAGLHCPSAFGSTDCTVPQPCEATPPNTKPNKQQGAQAFRGRSGLSTPSACRAQSRLTPGLSWHWLPGGTPHQLALLSLTIKGPANGKKRKPLNHKHPVLVLSRSSPLFGSQSTDTCYHCQWNAHSSIMVLSLATCEWDKIKMVIYF